MFAAAMAPVAAVAQQPARATVIENVRVFDGRTVIPAATVLIEGGKIVKVGKSVARPAGAEVVDGRGKTLLPGLIDAHTHAFPGSLRDALVAGVTTELDMFTDVNFARAMRTEQEGGKGDDRADLRSAGTLVTAPKGHGTEYGTPIPTLTSPAEAAAFVDARLAEGSDYIKVVYDDGATYELDYPTLDKATLKAVIDATHRRGKLAVVHVGSLQGARDAIDAGADGLAHLFVDRDPDPAFGRFVASRRAFVVPTLTVLEAVSGRRGGVGVAADPRLAPYISAENAVSLNNGFPLREGSTRNYAAAEQSVRQLKAAGVPILAGTDAPNPGTAHGASMHRELELLVQAGLTPVEALRAATSAPAAVFRLTDRGRIAPGLRADLVLVNGDPTADIHATRDIVAVWKRGVPVDRESYRATVAKAREAAANRRTLPAPAGSERGLVSDFDAGAAKAEFGAGWVISTDQMAGGKSTATMTVVPGGAEGSAGSLAVRGTLDASVPYAWAGAMFSPGATMMAPANLSAKTELRFWAKGDGRTYQVMLFAASRGRAPLMRPFVAGAEWREIVIPFSAFGDIDGSDIMAMVFSANGAPGEFSFQIDGVRVK